MKSTILLILLVFISVGYAQCPPAEYILRSELNKKSEDFYEVNSQSSSGAILGDETFEMVFVAQSGMDYRVTTKALKENAGTLSYEVYEMIVEKRQINGKETFKKIKHVLATSAEFQGQPLEFATEKTRKIFLSVTLVGGEKKKPHCVGVLIENKTSIKIGL